MLHVVITVVAMIIVIDILWLLAIRPNKITQERRDKMKPFENVYIAHRGLFNNKAGSPEEKPTAPENSLEAFRLAIAHGYGMEMDVQLTRDGKLVVFHDGDLKRMCGIEKNVLDCSYEELQKMSLKGSDQRIPLFSEVRDLVSGQVPMIIEVKPEGDCTETSRVLNEHMQGYDGIYCMESFDPRAVHWYRKNRPDIIRGQLSEKFKNSKEMHHNFVRKLCQCLLFNFWGRPDFISYNHHHKNEISYQLLRRVFPVFNVAWTIRSQEELEHARDTFTVFIFDSFIPDSDEIF